MIQRQEKKYFKSIPYDQSGFTLIETTFVIIIGGLIMALFFGMINSTLRGAKERENKQKFELIQNEINRFVYTHGRYPCPARLQAEVGTSNFGQESLSDCNSSAPPSDVFETTGRAGKKILIGAVPTRKLNLPDEYVSDAYGGRFLYAVTASMAETDSFVNGDGAISLNDANGNSVIDPPNRAPYVLVSHGENKMGAYDFLYGASSDCSSAGGMSDVEIENCDRDNVFISTLMYAEDQTNYYDDYVVTDFGFSNQKYGVPSGSVLYFNLSTCPGDSWTLFSGSGTPPGLIACQKL